MSKMMPRLRAESVELGDIKRHKKSGVREFGTLFKKTNEHKFNFKLIK